MKLFGVLLILTALVPGTGIAEFVVAKRTIRSHAVLTADDFELKPGELSDAVVNPATLHGLESRRVLYKGRPVFLDDVGPAAVIERNQIVTLIFANGPLVISAEARSLGRASIGERVRVINLSSRKTVDGTVNPAGQVVVGPTNSSRQK